MDARKTAPRRKTVAKKTAAKKAATRPRATKPKAAFRGGDKVLERYEEQGQIVLKACGGDADKITPALATKLKMSVGKAQRLLTLAQLKPSDRLYKQDLTEADLGKVLVGLRDTQGLRWMPDIWARTHITEAKAVDLYTKAGGAAWTTPRAKAPSKPTARAKRSAKKAPTGGGTPRKRAHLLDEVKDLGTTDEQVKEILDGRRIKVEVHLDGVTAAAQVHQVDEVKKVGVSPKYGRFVEFLDANRQNRAVALSEIVDLR